MSELGSAPVHGRLEPRPETGRRRWIIRYQVAVAAVVVIAGFVAIIAAASWPIKGSQIQASFFLSLASSYITLFGLVFTLCLIGTQFMAARTNVVIRRIFGPGTWLYLFLFVVTTVWTLAISYRAGDSGRSSRLCTVAASAKVCLTEARAGRISIFGVTWSFLLLLPFVLYVYRRLTVTYAFSSIATSALRARTVGAFKRRCDRLRYEILAVVHDDAAVAQGLSYLLEVGVVAIKRSRHLRKCTAFTDAHEITSQFCQLNRAFSSRPMLSSRVIQQLEEWSIWIASQAKSSADESHESEVMLKTQARSIVRMSVDATTSIFPRWISSPAMMPAALASVSFLENVAAACKSNGVRVSFVPSVKALSDCALHKSTEGSEGEFNLAMRGLISLVDVVEGSRKVNLGSGTVIKFLGGLLSDLGALADTRKSIPLWVLNELHELTDTISRYYDSAQRTWTQYLTSLLRLRDREILMIFKGPTDRQHQKKAISHSAWQSVVLSSARALASEEVTLELFEVGIAAWAEEGDLNEAENLFEKLTVDYVNDDGRYTLVLIEAVANGFRRGFQENPTIKELLWQRRLAHDRRRGKR